MDWDEWEPHYRRIASGLGLSIEEDRKATHLLEDILMGTNQTQSLGRLERVLHGSTVVVCGSGPSLPQHLDMITTWDERPVIVAADGATSAVLEKGMICDVITTDLDGNIDDLLAATSEGSLPIVHAHGDNTAAIKECVPLFQSVLGSTQVEPLEHVHLWGGFTDGDRACFLAVHYGCKRLVLAGMDFGDTVGRWSKPGHVVDFPASERKQKKLEIARDLLSYLESTTTIGIEYL